MTPHKSDVAAQYIEVIELLARAITERRCVHIVYYAASRDALTERVIEPLELRPEGRGYLLVAY